MGRDAGEYQKEKKNKDNLTRWHSKNFTKWTDEKYQRMKSKEEHDPQHLSGRHLMMMIAEFTEKLFTKFTSERKNKHYIRFFITNNFLNIKTR